MSACALTVVLGLLSPPFAYASSADPLPVSVEDLLPPPLSVDPLAQSSFANKPPAVAGPTATGNQPAEEPDETGLPLTRADLRAPDIAAAKLLSATTGKRVVVESMLDATSTTFANPDGTFNVHTYAGPVRVAQPGGWSEIDTLLVKIGDRVGPVMNVGRVTFSPGGTGALARQKVDGGEIALGWDDTLPAPTTVDNEARYRSVDDATDLVLYARPSGFEFNVVINERPIDTVPVYRFPLSLPAGWTAVPTAGGALRLLDAAGAERGSVSSTLAHGYGVDPMTGEPAQKAYSPTTVETEPDGDLTLVLRPDPAFLADPKTVYPVVVDPTVRTNTAFDTYVDSHWASQSYPSTLDIHAGHYYDSNQNYSANTHAFVGFSTSSYAGKAVSAATLYLYLNHQWACSPAQPTEVWTTSAAPTSTTNWTNKPSMVTKYATLSTSAGDTCGGKKYVNVSVTSLAQLFASKTAATRYIGLRATNENDNYQYHKYASANAGTTVIPYMNVTYADAPSAPRSPTVSPGDLKCTVGWTAPSSTGGDTIDAYKITAYRYGISGAVSSVSVGGTVRSHVYTGLSNGHTWAFDIQAHNSSGYSPAVRTADCIPSGVPQAPGSVTASATSTTTTVNWTSAPNNGATITGYMVKREDLSTVAPQMTTTTPHGSSVRTQTDSAILGHPYRYTVWAVNKNGSGATKTVNITAGMSDNARAVNATGGSLNVTVKWTNPETDAVTPWVTGYTVKLFNASTNAQVGTTQTTTASARQFAFGSTHGVVNGTTYYGTVQATGTGRTSTAVRTLNDVTAGPANVPTSVAATAVDTEASVTWGPPTNDGPPSGPSVASYTVTLYEKNASGGWDNKGAVAAGENERKQTRTGLSNGKSYYFTVVSNTDYNGSSAAAPSNTVVAGLPHPPRNVAATGGNASGTVTWSNPDNDGPANGGPDVTGYRVDIFTYDAESDGPGNFVEGGDVGATIRSYPTTTTLDNGQRYYATVVARSANGDSAAASATFLPSSVPDAPTDVSAEETPVKTAGKTAATVHFVVGVDGGSPVQYCRIEATDANGVATGQFADVHGCAGETSGQVGGLSYDTTYRFRVRAVNASTENVGNGPGSSPWSALSDPITTGGPGTVTKAMSGVNGAHADRGDGVTYTITVANPRAKSLRVQSVLDQFPAGFDPGPAPVVTTALNGGASQSCAAAGLTCSMTQTQLLVSPFDLASGTTRTFTFHGILTGAPAANPAPTDGSAARACALVQNAATLDDRYQDFEAKAPQVTTCNGGLGNEQWWTMVTRMAGADSSASVNTANGNVVVSATDGPPVQSRGHLALALRRTYNSQDTSLVTLPGSIGKGWAFNVGETGLTGAGVAGQRLAVPTVQDAVTAVTSPLSLALVDRDGTRHVFEPRLGLPGLDGVSFVAYSRGLEPRVLAKDLHHTNVCIDVAYKAPAGVHLGLWRYVQVTSTDPDDPCASSSTWSTATPQVSPVVLGYVAIRPDRLRTEYDATGRLLSMVDPAGAELRYTYDTQQRLAAVRESRCGTCRSITLSYAADGSSVTAVDAAGRAVVYNLTATTISGIAVRVLTSVQYKDSTAAPVRDSVSYTYQGVNDPGCNGSPGQLCTIVDERGNVTKLTYDAATSTAPFLGLGRATSISDRRPEHYQTQFAYSDRTGRYAKLTVNQPASGNPADTANTSRQAVYEPIDGIGRVERLIEGAAGVTTSTSLRTTVWTWDGTRSDNTSKHCRTSGSPGPTTTDNNLCSLRRIGSSFTDPATNTVFSTPDEFTEYQYDDAGYVQRVSRSSAGSSNTSLVGTTAYLRQWFHADGTITMADETVADGGVVAGASPPSTSPVLFTLVDRTATVPPRGNAAGGTVAAYRTTYLPDVLRWPSAPVAPNVTSGSGACSNGAATGNTGLVCKTVTPHENTGASTTFVYDAWGALTSKTEPNNGTYTYTYYAEGDRNLVTTATAGGWLKKVTDPAGNFVMFGYDQAGNAVRSWDRNATANAKAAGLAESAYPGTAADPPSVAGKPVPYTQTLHDTRALDQGYVPWRWTRSDRDASGNTSTYVVDGLGNVTSATTPLGHTTTTQYDEDGRVTRVLTPEEATAPATPNAPTLYSYDAFGGLATMTRPNQARANGAAGFADQRGFRVSERYYYDALGRATETLRARMVGTSATGPAPCVNTGGTPSEPAFPANTLVCSSHVRHDSVDNAVWSRDAAGQSSVTVYDAAHRVTHTHTPPNDSVSTSRRPHTAFVYDANGNTTTVCQPRHFDQASPAACTDSTTGFVTRTGYDTAGRATTVTTYRSAGSAQTTVTAYNPSGTVKSVTDANNHTTEFGYDALNRRTRMTVPRDGSLKYTTYTLYDAVGNVVATVAPGANAASVYNKARISASRYDELHRVVDTIAGLDVTLDLTKPIDGPDNSARIATAAATNLAGNGVNTRSRQFYDADGNVVAMIDARAFTQSVATSDTPFLTRYAYDKNGQVKQQWTARSGPSGSTVDTNRSQLTTNEAAQCSAALPPAIVNVPNFPTGSRICTTSAVRDADGNATSVLLPTATGARTQRTQTVTYTADGLVLSAQAPDPRSDATGTGFVTTVENAFDGAGRVVSTKDALKLVTVTSYTPAGTVAQVTYPTGPNSVTHVRKFRYDANGNQTEETLPRKVVVNGSTVDENDTSITTYTTDNRVASISAPASSTTDRSVTSYTYDNAGNVLTVTPPSVNAGDDSSSGTGTSYTYFDDNLPRTTLAPWMTDGSKRRRTTYGYDPAGRKTSVQVDVIGSVATGSPVTETGQPQTFGYHLNDLQYQELGRGGADRVFRSFDAVGNPTCIVSGPTSVSPWCGPEVAGNSVVTADYYADALPRVVREYHPTGGNAFSEFSYDGAGGIVLRRTDAITRYTQNDAGLAVSMQNFADGGRTTAWTYDERGHLTSELAPDGTTRTLSYNTTTDGTLAGVKVANPTTTLGQWTYARDEAYRLVEQAYTGTTTAGAATSATLRYAYDAGGRLTSFTNGTAAAKSLTWDHNGNRLSYGQQQFTYNADDSLATSNPGGLGAIPKTMTYDAHGRMTDDMCMTYGYDGLDRMTSVAANAVQLDTSCAKGSVTYAYDGFDRQVERSETSVAVTRSANLYHDGFSSLAVSQTFTGGTGPSSLTYVLGPSGTPRTALVVNASVETPQYLVDDGTGSTGMTTSGGALACALRYDPFGQVVQNNNNAAPASGSCYTGTTSIDRLYRGARRDGTTGNYQLGSRTYDPSKASFLTADSIRGGSAAENNSLGVDPLTRNSYSYVNGDPVNLVDPSGHRPACPEDGPGAAWHCDPNRKTREQLMEDYYHYRVVPAYFDHLKAEAARCAYKTAGLSCFSHPEYEQMDALFDLISSPDPCSRIEYGSFKRSLCNAANAAVDFTMRHSPLIVGALTFGGCALATGGAGSFGCATLAGSAAGATEGARSCDGDTGCLAKHTVIGGVGGATFGAAGGLSGGVLRTTLAGATASGTTNALTQQAFTGRIDRDQVLKSALVGGVTAGATRGAGTAISRGVQRLRSTSGGAGGAPTPRPEPAGAIIARTAQHQARQGAGHLMQFMKPGERAAYLADPARGSRFLGQAVHRATARQLGVDHPDRFLYRTRGPDFVDKTTGEILELTTPGQVASHMTRPGYDGVTYATYVLGP